MCGALSSIQQVRSGLHPFGIWNSHLECLNPTDGSSLPLEKRSPKDYHSKHAPASNLREKKVCIR